MIVVLPGDDVTEHISNNALLSRSAQQQATPAIKLGTGVVLSEDSGESSSAGPNYRFKATVAGRLLSNPRQATAGVGGVYFVRQNLKRYYQPSLEDRVIGIVLERQGMDSSTGGELYRVNIGGSHPATLSSLSFEGATKRNRPSLQPGQVLYSRIAALHRYLDPVLSCQLGPDDAGIPRKDWMTNEGCYGELRGGTICRITSGLARELLQPQNVVLSELSRRLAFEVAIGVNGYLWIHSSRPQYTIVIQNAILNSSVLTDGQVRAMVQSLIYTVEKQLQKQNDAMDE